MDMREYLYQRRNRCVGRILGDLERIVPTSLMSEVRSVIKTKISDYHTDVLDAVEHTESVNNVQFNAIAMRVKDISNG